MTVPVEVASKARDPSLPAGIDQRVYYPELDGLRFVAFALVYLFHAGLSPHQLNGLFGPTLANALRMNGWVGVQIFFVLSGFLITTLLLREEARYGRIDVRSFWVRRILRIWPLYYLTVAIAFGVIPWSDGQFASSFPPDWLSRHLPAFLAFLGNWSMVLRGPVINDSQSILWSVCVEEQFYLVCPLLLAWIAPRYRIGLVVGLMGLAILDRYLLASANVAQHQIQYSSFAQLDTLLGGVLLALVLTRWPPGRRADRLAGLLQWLLLGLTVWLFTRSDLGHGVTWRRTWDFVAIWMSAVGVVAVAVVRRGWFRAALAYSRLVWLGKISYGLYMYHELALWLRERFEMRFFGVPNEAILASIFTFALTVGFAALSYYGIERFFLKLKARWTRVSSRPI